MVAARPDPAGARRRAQANSGGIERGGSIAGPVEGVVNVLGGSKIDTIGAPQVDANQFGAKQYADNQAAARYGQQQLIGQLQQQSRGEGPSLANMQLQRNLLAQRNMAQSMAQSARGGMGALAQRNAAMQMGMAGEQTARMAGEMQLREQMQAQGLLGQQLQAQRAADLQAMGMSVEQAIAQANAEAQIAGANAEIQQHNAGRTGRAIGNAVKIGGALAMMSDANVKEGIKEATPAYEGVLPVQYRYKKEAAEAIGTDTEPRVGILAQHLEKSPKFRGSVVETPLGKAVDVNRALSTALAEGAALHKRLSKVEAMVGGI